MHPTSLQIEIERVRNTPCTYRATGFGEASPKPQDESAFESSEGVTGS